MTLPIGGGAAFPSSEGGVGKTAGGTGAKLGVGDTAGDGKIGAGGGTGTTLSSSVTKGSLFTGELGVVVCTGWSSLMADTFS
jgi:hypothetical protein